MFSQVQMIIAAVAFTVVATMGGTIWFLYGSLDKTKEKLLVEKVVSATAIESLKNTKAEITRVTKLLKSVNIEMTEIRNERDEAKGVLQDSSRLARLAQARSTLISSLAVDATARLWNDFEDISRETTDPLP